MCGAVAGVSPAGEGDVGFGVLRVFQEVSLLNPDFPHEEVNPGDLSPGDDPWDLEGHRSHAGAVFLLPQPELPPTSRHDPPHGHRRGQEKR